MIPHHLFKDRITIQRRTNAADAGGHVVPTWANHLTGVPCSVQPGDGDEPERGGGKQPSQKYRIYLDAAVDVVSTDRIVFAGSTLRIEGPGKNLVQFNRVTRIDCVVQKP